MRLASIESTGFRNLAGVIEFAGPLTLLIGANNAGKSNVIDALRLLTVPRAGMQHRKWITSDDFRHDGGGEPSVDTFELTATFRDLSTLERARMVTCLSPSLGSDAAKLRLVAQQWATGKVNVTWYGGDSKMSGVEPWARESIQHTYLHPLRDAAADLRPGRDNKLVRLLGSLAPPKSVNRTEIEAEMLKLTAALSGTQAVSKAQSEIQNRLTEMVGPVFAQQTGLKFADTRFDRIVAALRALAGDSIPLELMENGLGYNNLLYMATLLAAIESDSSTLGTHLLLVEEPEAHLHPQLQDLLLKYLDDQAKLTTQVVLTTHSPNFAAGAGVSKMTVLVRSSLSTAPQAHTPKRFALDNDEFAHLQRFLDATKSGLLFARGVVLVEGIAEQLIIPGLASRLGLSLAQQGISVVNVGGLSFAPFAKLFSPAHLPSRCAVITDGDPPETEDELHGGNPSLSATAKSIKKLENTSMRVFLSRKTLEWDLVKAGNWNPMLHALSMVKPIVAKTLATNDPKNDDSRADQLLKAMSNIKGRYAQALAAVLSTDVEFSVPDYLKEALAWVTPAVKD